jgi:hypothetical protein
MASKQKADPLPRKKMAAPEHCETCCPWYPQPCEEFGGDFAADFQGCCGHNDCVVFDGCVGDRLVHGDTYPYECLPWKADMSCCDDWKGHDEALQKRALTLAWNTMRSLTAGRIAATCVTMRPCLSQDDCDDCYGNPGMGTAGMSNPSGILNPVLLNGGWYNWPKCRDKDCSCCDMCELEMPGRVAALLEVNIDGYRHDPRLFRIDNGNRLVRQDGCCWPSCQDMGAPYGYYGTFGVKYVPGVMPDASGLWAVGVLACEYAKACTGEKCRLPRAVTSVAKQGVAMEFPSGMFDNGTGIHEVDAYIYGINPNKLTTPSRVYSPDLVTAKHRFTTNQPRGVWP